ncbi:MAG: hypothetical protein ACYCYO_22965 [Bacilli bacterium]
MSADNRHAACSRCCPQPLRRIRCLARTNIWNPVDNSVAAIRYIAGRYGTPQGIPGLETGNYSGY